MLAVEILNVRQSKSKCGAVRGCERNTTCGVTGLELKPDAKSLGQGVGVNSGVCSMNWWCLGEGSESSSGPNDDAFGFVWV